MRETLKDWKKEWIDTNGETHELEVIICDSKLYDGHPPVYEGSFYGIPNDIIDKKVIECGKILDSSIHDRVGAYCLLI